MTSCSFFNFKYPVLAGFNFDEKHLNYTQDFETIKDGLNYKIF